MGGEDLRRELLALRMPIRDRVRAELEHEYARRVASGEVPFEGLWLPRAELPELARRIRRRRWLASVETLAALALGGVVVLGLFWLFRYLLIPL